MKKCILFTTMLNIWNNFCIFADGNKQYFLVRKD